MTTTSRPQSAAARNLVLFLKGMAIGAADSVPGVSGGTIAVISGIYDELIYSLRSVDLRALRLLFQGSVRGAWVYINGTFLLVLLCGIVIGLRLSAGIVIQLLDQHFEPLMGFFIGMVLASCWFLKRQFGTRGAGTWLAVAAGMLLTGLVSAISPQVVASVSLGYLFLCGMLGICAMILPGISGAFLLLMLGVYQYLLEALVALNWPVILVFMSGCVVGLLSFSRILSWALRLHHDLTYAFLSGMLLASVWILWPWQQTISFSVGSDGVLHVLESMNVWPSVYQAVTGQDPRLLQAGLAFVAGGTLIIGFEKLFQKSAE